MYQFPFICHLLCPNIMITMKDTTQIRESSRNLPKSLSANREPQLTGKTGHQWTQIVTPEIFFSKNVPGVLKFQKKLHWFGKWYTSSLDHDPWLEKISERLALAFKSYHPGNLDGGKNNSWQNHSMIRHSLII